MSGATVRLRLTALYGAVFVACSAALLGVSYWLLERHLERTLPGPQTEQALAQLATWYVVALAGATLLAVAAGWALARRALAPIADITATAKRVTQDDLGERIALDGPQDELRDLAEAFDAMLDRLDDGFDAQRRFVANASHELRSPLTIIRTEVEVALADPDASTGELRDMGEGVLEAGDRMEALLDGLMVLARSRRGVLAAEEVDLGSVARAALGDIRPGRVRVWIDGRPARVRGDRRLLERVAANLVANGVLYNHASGWVSVHTGVEDGQAVLRVTNSGPRVDPAIVGQLLEPFERGGRRADGRGAGLGLSIVQSIAEAHGGGVTLIARDEGGLIAEVALPLATARASAGPARAARGSRATAPPSAARQPARATR